MPASAAPIRQKGKKEQMLPHSVQSIEDKSSFIPHYKQAASSKNDSTRPKGKKEGGVSCYFRNLYD